MAKGRERGGGGAATPSLQLGGLGSAVSSPSGVRSEARLPRRLYTIFSTQLAFTDTKILLTVDYHAAMGGGKTP